MRVSSSSLLCFYTCKGKQYLEVPNVDAITLCHPLILLFAWANYLQLEIGNAINLEDILILD
jgi:hypothetical protein